MSRRAIALLLMAVGAAAAGCAQPRMALLTPPEPPVVWPKDPDPPRLRYLGELKGSTDVHPAKDMGQVWDELLHGPQAPSMLESPHAVAVHADGQRVAVADINAACVHVFNLERQTYERRERVGSEHLEAPSAVTWAGEALFVADAKLHGVAAIGGGGADRWIGRSELKRPAGLAYCAKNDLLYVADAGAHAVLAFERGGKLAFQFGSHGTGTGQLNCPTQVACGADDTLAVVDSLNFRVQRFKLDGEPAGTFGSKGDAAGDLSLPKGVAVGSDGNLWIMDANFENIQAFTPEGKLLIAFGQEGHGPGEFWLPAGMCIDSKARLWVADTYNKRVQVFELLK
jgi:DNA-binding beta-propeller fold protein YncE